MSNDKEQFGFNATLFSTGRLMKNVAEKKDLPSLLAKENKANIPYNAILSIAGLGALLAVIGSLGTLVDAASLIFLITFGTVNWLAWQQKIRYHWLSLIGSLGCVAAIILSSYRQLQEKPGPPIIMMVLIVLALVGRSYLLRRMGD